MAIAGLDIGSGGCKCTIFNDDGTLSSYAFEEYDLERGSHGHMELDPRKVWGAVQNVCQKANKKHIGDRVKALCIASLGESGAVLDKNGKELYNSFTYSDPRGNDACIKMVEKMGRNEIMSRSGHSPHPMYSAYKLMWLRDNEPTIYKEIDVFLQYAEYILYKLSGEKCVDWSLASRTMMFNVLEKKWDDTLLDGSGLKKSIFPKVVQTGKPIAQILGSAAKITGFPENTILLLGGQDQIVAAIGGGAIKAGQAVNGIGSVDCITPVFDKPIINDVMGNAGYACVPYLTHDNYVTYAFNFSGGSLLRWYRDKFGQAAIAEGKQKNISPYSILESGISNEPTGLLVLPHFQGATTPYMDIHALGAIVGLTMDTDSKTLYRGLMEGIAYEMKTNINYLKKAGVTFHRLRVCGGGSRSDIGMQLRADIFNMPIDVLEVEEAGTLGAAILAGVACNVYKNIEDSVNKLVKVKKTFYPDAKIHKQYREHYYRYERMYENIKNIEGRG